MGFSSSRPRLFSIQPVCSGREGMFSVLLGGSHTQRADASSTSACPRGFTAQHMDSAAHPAKGGHTDSMLPGDFCILQERKQLLGNICPLFPAVNLGPSPSPARMYVCVQHLAPGWVWLLLFLFISSFHALSDCARHKHAAECESAFTATHARTHALPHGVRCAGFKMTCRL